MKLLLDTHALLWLVNGDEKLTQAARSEIANPANDLFVSVATIWELAIKTTKPSQPLILNDPLDVYLAKWIPAYRLDVLAIQQAHALQLLKLPNHHRGPFDRIIIAQALVEDMTLISGDGHFASYAIPIIW
jgi:PIN domain nuclease of toxin-antitoxin system